ncbi:choice-of-anchor M domain-containing protein [Psychromicrobium sp. YIM B11713]|uniref:choice-of-anchor M domain-containing protein n=1 Tax=Psychromicrobium sp. YIM B11713 TaxID=3145233 RepID=UPI00374EB343
MKLIPAALVTALLLGTLTAPLALAATPPPDLQQSISPDEPALSGQAVISDGHIDIGPRFAKGVNSDWSVQIHDSSGQRPVWRSLPDVVLQVSDRAKQVVPDDPSYGFLGVAPGESVYVVPQTQQPGVVWAGWNTQDPRVIELLKRQVRFSLLSTQGPGSVMMYLQSGDLGQPQILWDSKKPARQDIFVDANVHTHANWVFSEPGVYLLTVEFAAELKDGRSTSDRQVLRFAVGSVADPRAAFAEVATQQPTASASSTSQSQASPEQLLWLIGGGLLGVLVIVVLLLLFRSIVKSRRARAEVERAASGSGVGNGDPR